MKGRRVGFGILCRVLALAVGLGLGSVFAEGTLPESPVEGDNIIDQVGQTASTVSETGLPIFALIVFLIAAGAIIGALAMALGRQASWGQVGITIAVVIVVVPIVLYLINAASEAVGAA